MSATENLEWQLVDERLLLCEARNLNKLISVDTGSVSRVNTYLKSRLVLDFHSTFKRLLADNIKNIIRILKTTIYRYVRT